MKVQELRIGNYFLDEQGIVRKIICIDPDEDYDTNENNFCLRWGTHVDCSEWIENCSPVPLTEQVLLDCGFGKAGIDKGWRIFWLNNTCVEIKEQDLTIGYGVQYIFSRRISIEYLHQLQNLHYALTGTELQYNQQRPI